MTPVLHEDDENGTIIGPEAGKDAGMEAPSSSNMTKKDEEMRETMTEMFTLKLN